MPENFADVSGGSSSTAPNRSRSYTVRPGDSLSKIARELYGDTDRWREIFEANRDRIDDPDLIQPGWTLRIP